MWQAAAVQMRVDSAFYRNPDSFETKIRSLMDQVMDQIDRAEDVPLFVVFPEDVGTPCVFIEEDDVLARHQTLQGAVAALIKKHFFKVSGLRLRYRTSWVRALALLKGDRSERVYRDVFARVARDYDCYITAGSTLSPEFDHAESSAKNRPRRPAGPGVYNVSYTFDPKGVLINRQRKTHLIDIEDMGGLDLTKGSTADLTTFDTPFGRVGVAICLDAFQEDVMAQLKRRGLEILVQPSANPGVWDEPQRQDWLNGAWRAVQQGHFQAAINPMMVGDLLDLHFEGQSSIVGPGPKYLAQAPSPTEECIIVAQIPSASSRSPQAESSL